MAAPSAETRVHPVSAGTWHRLRGCVVDGIYPPRCDACGSLGRRLATEPSVEAAHENEHRAKTAGGRRVQLCRSCSAAWQPIDEPLCRCCGVPFATDAGASHLCEECLIQGHRFSMARAALVYQGAVRRLLHRFKYDHQAWLAGPFAEILAQKVRKRMAAVPIDVVVPVPLHIRRKRQRGFNQAHLLAKHLARRLPDATIAAKGALVRRVPTASQAGLGRRRRRRNVRTAFAADPAAGIAGRHVLLIDDVYTTGATADACAETLMGAGCAGVNVLTLARVPLMAAR